MTNKEGRQVDERTFKFAVLQKITEILKPSEQKWILDTQKHTQKNQAKERANTQSKYRAGNKAGEGAVQVGQIPSSENC